ncbi:MAG: hypothetical protein AB7S38_40905 [Vulcanimicrobiota bacterium]
MSILGRVKDKLNETVHRVERKTRPVTETVKEVVRKRPSLPTLVGAREGARQLDSGWRALTGKTRPRSQARKEPTVLRSEPAQQPEPRGWRDRLRSSASDQWNGLKSGAADLLDQGKDKLHDLDRTAFHLAAKPMGVDLHTDRGLFQELLAEHPDGGTNWSWGIEQVFDGMTDALDRSGQQRMDSNNRGYDWLERQASRVGLDGAVRFVERQHDNTIGGTSNALEGVVGGFKPLVAHPMTTLSPALTVQELVTNPKASAELLVNTVSGQELSPHQQQQLDDLNLIKNLASDAGTLTQLATTPEGGLLLASEVLDRPLTSRQQHQKDVFLRYTEDYKQSYDEYGVAGLISHVGTELSLEVLTETATGGGGLTTRVGREAAEEVAEEAVGEAVEQTARRGAREVVDAPVNHRLVDGRMGVVDAPEGDISFVHRVSGPAGDPSELLEGEKYLLGHSNGRGDFISHRNLLGYDAEGKPIWGHVDAPTPRLPSQPGVGWRNRLDSLHPGQRRRARAAAERDNLGLEQELAGRGEAIDGEGLRAISDNFNQRMPPQRLRVGSQEIPVQGLRGLRERRALQRELEHLRQQGGDGVLRQFHEVIVTDHPGVFNFQRFENGTPVADILGRPVTDPGRPGGFHLDNFDGGGRTLFIHRPRVGDGETLFHEVGHAVDFNNGQLSRRSNAFGQGGLADAASEYGLNNAAEDFAEIFRVVVSDPDQAARWIAENPGGLRAQKVREVRQALDWLL